MKTKMNENKKPSSIIPNKFDLGQTVNINKAVSKKIIEYFLRGGEDNIEHIFIVDGEEGNRQVTIKTVEDIENPENISLNEGFLNFQYNITHNIVSQISRKYARENINDIKFVLDEIKNDITFSIKSTYKTDLLMEMIFGMAKESLNIKIKKSVNYASFSYIIVCFCYSYINVITELLESKDAIQKLWPYIERMSEELHFSDNEHKNVYIIENAIMKITQNDIADAMNEMVNDIKVVNVSASMVELVKQEIAKIILDPEFFTIGEHYDNYTGEQVAPKSDLYDLFRLAPNRTIH